MYKETDFYINNAKIKSCEMKKMLRNRLFPFHSVRCLKYFAKQDVHHSFEQNLGIEPPGSVLQVEEVKT